jgi:hypothetical protein
VGGQSLERKGMGSQAAMEALIAVRDRGWRPWVHPHGGGKRMGGPGVDGAWCHVRAAAQGRRCRVTHGRGRGRERGSWQVARPAGLAPPISERRGERERTDWWVWVAHRPGFKWIKNNPNLIQTRPN